jgi:hypothetical protein
VNQKIILSRGGYSIFDGGVPVFPGSIIKFDSFADTALMGWHVMMLAANNQSNITPFAICFDNSPPYYDLNPLSFFVFFFNNKEIMS